MPTKIPGFPGLDELSLVDDESDSPAAGPATFGERDGRGEYRGPERRKYQRRQGGDRRGKVRFEPGKAERRSGLDRRKGSWKTHSTV